MKHCKEKIDEFHLNKMRKTNTILYKKKPFLEYIKSEINSYLKRILTI